MRLRDGSWSGKAAVASPRPSCPPPHHHIEESAHRTTSPRRAASPPSRGGSSCCRRGGGGRDAGRNPTGGGTTPHCTGCGQAGGSRPCQQTCRGGRGRRCGRWRFRGSRCGRRRFRGSRRVGGRAGGGPGGRGGSEVASGRCQVLAHWVAHAHAGLPMLGCTCQAGHATSGLMCHRRAGATPAAGPTCNTCEQQQGRQQHGATGALTARWGRTQDHPAVGRPTH